MRKQKGEMSEMGYIFVYSALSLFDFDVEFQKSDSQPNMNKYPSICYKLALQNLDFHIIQKIYVR